ncbi:MAG: glucuronate isomerase, partial [Phaeodactylibacter sp.]|nr:glucuronate isomerase [Phaeodactylibacter sp.]
QNPAFSARNLLLKMGVRTLCTTDDPVDTLEHHRKIKADNFGLTVLPTFRPDRALAVESPAQFQAYLDLLEAAAGTSISSYAALQSALRQRHDFFAETGCRVSDHGLNTFYAAEVTEAQMGRIFDKLRAGKALDSEEILQFKSGMLLFLAELDFEKGWVQQFHVGALRDANPEKLRVLGPNTGFDSIGDGRHAQSMANFLATLEERGKLTKTIGYNLNPADNYIFAGMAGNFQDGTVPGKIQYGSGWWFLDQKEGIEWQLNALSNQGLLSRFVGMLTDSRSFLSYPRHEYFRRILCNLIGSEIEKGLLPREMEFIGNMVADICYRNAKNYFGFN